MANQPGAHAEVAFALSESPSGLAFREVAGARGPVVFLHGWAAGSSIWATRMARLRGRVRALAPDLPGHGDSDLDVPRGLTVSENAVQRFAHWCHERGVADAPIVAWAWGTQVALSAVYQDLIEPRSLFLVSPVVDPSTPDPYSGPLSRDWPRYVRSIARLLTATPLSVEAESWLANIMSSASIAAAGGIHAAQLSPPGIGYRLPPNSRAILGGADVIADPSIARRAVEGWGGEAVTMPQVGHMPFLENPRGFDEQLDSWLEVIGVIDAPGL